MTTFRERLIEPRKYINPPKHPGLGHEFVRIGRIPRTDAQLWDNRTGRWRDIPVNFCQPVRSANSHIMPYGWYRQRKLKPARK